MKHPHAEIIKSWADGAQIQVKDGQNWYDIDEGNQIFSKHFEYRIKPAEPERDDYPKTSLSSEELGEIVQKYSGDGTDALRFGVANAVLRHACENGQIVARAEFDRAVGDRQKRDKAIALAVGEYVGKTVAANIAAGLNSSNIDLSPIIAQVK